MLMIPKQRLSGKIEDPELKLRLKELELNALLEITEAINANLSEDALYRIYHFTLLSNLHISKLALFVLDETWNCKVKYGCLSEPKPSDFEEIVGEINTITTTGEKGGIEEFDVIIPISHKSRNLAFVLLGGIHTLDLEDSDSVLSFVQTLSSILIVAIENKKLARRQLQQEALRKELEIAGKVQTNLFPRFLPDNDLVKIKASYLPHLMVGGDYYDFIEISPDQFLICIADVSGKGIPAAILMSSFQSGLKTLLRRTKDLTDIVSELNHLVKINARGERFITFFGAIADLSQKTFTYINAGHNPPILLEKRQTSLLEKGTTVLGAFDTLPFVEAETLDLEPGALFFAYTDGLTETFNEQGQEFGAEKLEDILKKLQAEPETLHESLLENLNNFRGSRNFSDDVTFISCLFR